MKFRDAEQSPVPASCRQSVVFRELLPDRNPAFSVLSPHIPEPGLKAPSWPTVFPKDLGKQPQSKACLFLNFSPVLTDPSTHHRKPSATPCCPRTSAHRVGQEWIYRCEYAKQGLFWHRCLLITVLSSMPTTVDLL